MAYIAANRPPALHGTADDGGHRPRLPSADECNADALRVAALAGLLLLGRRRTRAAGCLLLTFLLGAALGIRTANPTLPPEGDAQVTGVVAGEVDFRAEKGQVRVILRDVTLNGERIASGAYWTYYLKTDENIPDFLCRGQESA